MTVLNAAFPAEFVEWFPGEDFADGANAVTTIDVGPFIPGRLVSGDIDLASLTQPPIVIDFSDDIGNLQVHELNVTVTGTRWSATLPSDTTIGTKHNVALTDSHSNQDTVADFSVVAAGGGGTPRSNGLQLVKLGARL